MFKKYITKSLFFCSFLRGVGFFFRFFQVFLFSRWFYKNLLVLCLVIVVFFIEVIVNYFLFVEEIFIKISVKRSDRIEFVIFFQENFWQYDFFFRFYQVGGKLFFFQVIELLIYYFFVNIGRICCCVDRSRFFLDLQFGKLVREVDIV